jgi:hypothetical protein
LDERRTEYNAMTSCDGSCIPNIMQRSRDASTMQGEAYRGESVEILSRTPLTIGSN